MGADEKLVGQESPNDLGVIGQDHNAGGVAFQRSGAMMIVELVALEKDIDKVSGEEAKAVDQQNEQGVWINSRWEVVHTGVKEVFLGIVGGENRS
jgi:hypothetical protein